MSSPMTNELTQFHHKFTFLSSKNIANLCKSLIILSLIFVIFYLLLPINIFNQSSSLILANHRHKWSRNGHPLITCDYSPTNISHLIFGIASSVKVWEHRKPYVESWWRPNITNGYLFLEREPMSFFPWPSSSPPYRIFEDTSRYREFDKHPMTFAIRMVRVILQTFRENHGDGVRWYIMADDDTILFLKNLVEILARYDHRKYFYIGENSECILSNMENSFEMAFGGAGYALSYPLAEAIAKNMEVCIKRYPTLFGSDHILQACIADLGVSLTHEKGFHQIDLHGDISGFLSSHPQSPFISLHHLDTVDPLFPFMNRSQSLSHLMKAAEADQSRLLQQTICYQHQQNWSFSISWGYSVQIYEQLIPPSFLLRQLETFAPWRKLPPRQPPYRFNTRLPSRNPCEDPHVFFFESVEEIRKDRIFTTYRRRSGRRERDCNYSTAAADVFRVSVISPATRYGGVGTRRECCDIVKSAVKDNVKIKIRSCMKYEIIA